MSVNIFQSWANQYPSWEALKNYLTSEDVGVSIREFTDAPSYAILRYVKGKTNFESHPELVWARSVVWNKDTHRPVCVAPRKANQGLPPLNTKLSVETFVDGVMVNVFATRSVSGDISFHTTTRSQLNADGFFYSSKSFLVLFMEALKQRNIHSVNELFHKDILPSEEVPSVFLSFVLQHPEHRVVERVRTPVAYLVQHGGVRADGSVEFYPKHPVLSGWYLSELINREFPTEKDIYQYLREQAYQRGWTWQGLVFKDEEGNRWRLRTSTYSLLRSLRGSEASPELRFLRLRSEGKMSDYLKHYHEDRQVFWNFEQKLRKETRAAYDAYIDVHKAHAKKLGDLENPIRTAVYLLHSHYLKDLRPQNQSVVLATAIELINSMPHWQQAQFLKA
jgi:hypothetical protein